MKTLAKPIEVISWTEEDGEIRPLRFRMLNEEGERSVHKIRKIYSSEMDRIAGNKVYKFNCELHINGRSRLCEIRYDLDTCKWNLFKM